MCKFFSNIFPRGQKRQKIVAPPPLSVVQSSAAKRRMGGRNKTQSSVQSFLFIFSIIFMAIKFCTTITTNHLLLLLHKTACVCMLCIGPCKKIFNEKLSIFRVALPLHFSSSRAALNWEWGNSYKRQLVVLQNKA